MVGIDWIDDQGMVIDVFIRFSQAVECLPAIFGDHIVSVEGINTVKLMRAGNNFRVGLIGPGVAASHSTERTHKEGIIATVDLCVAYIENM